MTGLDGRAEEVVDMASRTLEEGPLIVIGGSAGALKSLLQILSVLPVDFQAAMMIVLHMAEGATGLATVLESHSQLPVRDARDGEPLQAGVIVVGVHNSHLMLQDGHLWLHRGPRENRHRPAIDPLFRSAARFYGPRVTGVLLSGLQDDGVAGLIRIQKAGGHTIVQSPSEALYPDLPRAALSHLTPDQVLTAAEIGSRIVELAKATVPAVGESLSSDLDVQSRSPVSVPEHPPEPFTCPTCHGNLWKVSESDFEMYRCRIGHVFTVDSLGAAVDQAVESSLWTAIRSLEEGAVVANNLARKANLDRLPAARHAHEERARELLSHSQVLRDLIEGNLKPD